MKDGDYIIDDFFAGLEKLAEEIEELKHDPLQTIQSQP